MSSRLGRCTSSPSRSIARSSAQPVSAVERRHGLWVVSSTSPLAPFVAGARPAAPPRGRRSREAEADGRRAALAIAELVRAALGDDPARRDDRHAIRQPLRLVHVMRGEEDRLARALQVRDHLPGLAARRGVEAGRRLVEEEQLGVADQGDADVEAPLLAAGELGGAVVGLSAEADQARSSPRPRAASRSSRRTSSASRGP